MDTIDEHGRRAAAAVREQVRPFVRDAAELNGLVEAPARRTLWWTVAAAAVVVAIALTAFFATRDGRSVTDPVDSVPSTDASSTTAAGTPAKVPSSGIVLLVPTSDSASAIDTTVHGVAPRFVSDMFDDGTVVSQPDSTSIVVQEPGGSRRVLATAQGDGAESLALWDAGVADGRKVVLYGFVPADKVANSTPDGQPYELHTIGADGSDDALVFQNGGGAFVQSASLMGGTVHVLLNVLTEGEQYVIMGGTSVGPIGTRLDPTTYSSADGTVQAVFTGQTIRLQRLSGGEVTIQWGDDRPTLSSVELESNRMIVNVADGAPFLVDGLFDGAPAVTRLPDSATAARFVLAADAPDLNPTIDCTWTGAVVMGDGAMGSHYTTLSLTNSTDRPCVAPMVTGGALQTANGLVGLRFDRDLMTTPLPPIVAPGQAVDVITQTSSNYDVCGAIAPVPATQVILQIERRDPVTIDVVGDTIDAACGGSVSQAISLPG